MSRSAKIRLAIGGILVGIAAAAWIALARYERAATHAWLHKNGYLYSETMELCAPDRTLEFKIGSKSFFLPWALARRTTNLARDLWVANNETCPSQPIERGGFFMFMPPNVAREHDLNLYIIEFGAIREWTLDNRPIPSNPATRITYADGGYFEDVTDLWKDARRQEALQTARKLGISAEDTRATWDKAPLHASDRYYRLQHPQNADGTENAPVLMSCVGDPNARTCYTRYRFEDDLVLDYRFFPSHLSPRDQLLHLPPAPSEPDELLAADARFRQWIDDLQKHP